LIPPPIKDEQIPLRRDFATVRIITAAVIRAALALLPRGEKLAAWGRLLRLPNLLTVPGDVLAGFLLAPAASLSDWGQLLPAIFAGILFYAAGLILNDLVDYKEDLRDRPQRPLPSGKILRETAAVFALVFLWVAAFMAAFFGALPIAIPLILCIVAYDGGLKKIPVLGPLLMGACRSGNLLLGAAAASAGTGLALAPVAAAIGLGLYIAAVTHLARNEAQPGAKITPRHIGQLLRLLIPLQALLCVVAVHRFPANLLGLALLPLLPLHRRLAQRFPPS
jgi:4-hydroxybenzoate polyprenyltransferase